MMLSIFLLHFIFVGVAGSIVTRSGEADFEKKDNDGRKNVALSETLGTKLQQGIEEASKGLDVILVGGGVLPPEHVDQISEAFDRVHFAAQEELRTTIQSLVNFVEDDSDLHSKPSLNLILTSVDAIQGVVDEQLHILEARFGPKEDVSKSEPGDVSLGDGRHGTVSGTFAGQTVEAMGLLLPFAAAASVIPVVRGLGLDHRDLLDHEHRDLNIVNVTSITAGDFLEAVEIVARLVLVIMFFWGLSSTLHDNPDCVKGTFEGSLSGSICWNHNRRLSQLAMLDSTAMKTVLDAIQENEVTSAIVSSSWATGGESGTMEMLRSVRGILDTLL